MNLKARLNRSDPHQPSSNYDSKESLSEMFQQGHVHLQEMPLTIQYLLFSVCVCERGGVCVIARHYQIHMLTTPPSLCSAWIKPKTCRERCFFTHKCLHKVQFHVSTDGSCQQASQNRHLVGKSHWWQTERMTLLVVAAASGYLNLSFWASALT